MSAAVMTIDFTCQKCEGGFEIDAQDLIDGSEKLECPHCGAKATASATEDFTTALADLKGQVTALSRRFAIALTIDSEDLDEEEEEEEEEDEEEDDAEDGDDDLDEDDDFDDDEDEDYEDEG